MAMMVTCLIFLLVTADVLTGLNFEEIIFFLPVGAIKLGANA